jgi:sulfoxide reductase heme-binding subunit YedZ
LAGLIHILNHRLFIWALLALPMVVLAVAYLQGQMFYGEVVHESGLLSARLLILTLAITPLRMLFPRARWPLWFRKRRRWFGVASFAYALQHTVIYLDKKADWSVIVADAMLFEMWTGWLSLGILMLLALSSNDFFVRLMMRSWKRLHRWVYAAAVLAFVHWVFIAFDFVPALVHLVILVGLESYRLVRLRGPAGPNK